MNKNKSELDYNRLKFIMKSFSINKLPYGWTVKDWKEAKIKLKKNEEQKEIDRRLGS